MTAVTSAAVVAAAGAVTADVVLQQLNSEFERSKSEQIHRFLRDQEELNHTLSQIEGVDSLSDIGDEDSDESETETLYTQRLDLYRVRPQSALGWHLSARNAQEEDKLSVSSAHFSDSDSDVGEEGGRQARLVCIGGRKPLIAEREDGRGGPMRRRAQDLTTNSSRRSQDRTSNSQETYAPRSRSKSRGPAVNKENRTSDSGNQGLAKDGRRRGAVLTERETAPAPSNSPVEQQPALSRKGSFRQRIYRVSAGTTSTSGAAPPPKPELTPKPPPVAASFRNMRPRTTTGIRRPRVSDGDPHLAGVGQGADQRDAVDRDGGAGVQRLRASAPACTTRHRRIVFEGDLSYLQVSGDPLLAPAPVQAPPPPTPRDRDKKLSASGTGPYLGGKMDDLSKITPANPPSDVNLEDIFSQTKHVPSYSTSAALKSGSREGLPLRQAPPPPPSADSTHLSSKEILPHRAFGPKDQRHSRPQNDKSDRKHFGISYASELGDPLNVSPSRSRNVHTSRKSQGKGSGDGEKHLTLLKLPPLEAGVGRGSATRDPGGPLLPPADTTATASTTEFLARS